MVGVNWGNDDQRDTGGISLLQILLPIPPSQVENRFFWLELVNKRQTQLVSRNHHPMDVRVQLLLHTVMRYKTAIILSDYHNEYNNIYII